GDALSDDQRHQVIHLAPPEGNGLTRLGREGTLLAPKNTDHPLVVDHPAGVETGEGSELVERVAAFVDRRPDHLLRLAQSPPEDLLKAPALVVEVVVD